MTENKEYQRQRKILRHHRNQFMTRNKHSNHCQQFECDEHRVNIIRPPPHFQLRPPPSPLGFLSFEDSLFAVDLSRTSCKDPPSFNLAPIRYNTTNSGNEEKIFKFNKPVKEKAKLDFNSDTSSRISTTTTQIFTANKDTSILSLILVFGASLLTVLFVCMILYMCFTKKTCFFKAKCNKRKSCNQRNSSGKNVNSTSSLSQASYEQTNSLMRNFHNEQLNHQPTEFSQFIPSNPTVEAFKAYQDNQINYLKTIHAINRTVLSHPPNTYMSYDIGQSESGQKRPSKKKDSVRSLISSKTEKGKKKKQPFFKNSTVKAGKPLQITSDTCACSTLSTRATNESSSSTSSTSSPKSSFVKLIHC